MIFLHTRPHVTIPPAKQLWPVYESVGNNMFVNVLLKDYTEWILVQDYVILVRGMLQAEGDFFYAFRQSID